MIQLHGNLRVSIYTLHMTVIIDRCTSHFLYVFLSLEEASLASRLRFNRKLLKVAWRTSFPCGVKKRLSRLAAYEGIQGYITSDI